jgi:formate/nitrite transporter
MASNLLTHSDLGMDYIKPVDVAKNMVETAAAKAALSVKDLLIRGFLSGALLGFATSLALAGSKQTGVPLVGALIFPVGFVLIVLLGLELVTGNFALLPVGVQAGRVSASQLLSNFFWVYGGNLIGSLFYGFLLALTLKYNGTAAQNTITPLITAAAEAKTIGYSHLGAVGLLVCFIKAILCNWMVCLAVVAAMTSNSTIGKSVAAAIPIFIFFALGYEHSVVNMFLIPTGMMLGAKVSIAEWWLANQIPVTIGNFLAGWLLIGLPMFLTYGKQATETERRSSADMPEKAEVPA